MNVSYLCPMAPYGEIFGKDTAGNYKVKPLEGGRTVILSGSFKDHLPVGQRVRYPTTRSGRYVDFADNYSLLRSGAAEGNSTEFTPKFASEQDVRRIVGATDLINARVLMVYDPVRYTQTEFPFIGAATTLGAIFWMTDQLIDREGIRSYFRDGYYDENRVVGEQYWTTKDFRPTVDRGLGQGIVIVPIEGLAKGSLSEIPRTNFHAVVEAAKFPLEDRLRG